MRCRLVWLALGISVLLTATHDVALAAEKGQDSLAASFHAELDGWRIPGIRVTGAYYSGQPGAWFLGGWSKQGQVRLDRGKSYTIEGMMGWKAELAVSADGQVAVGKAEPGPHLAQPPAFRLIGSTYGIFMPPLHEVRFEVPRAYGAWRVDDTPEAVTGYWRTGDWAMTLPEGRWTMTGQAGWKVGFQVERDGVKVTDAESQRYGLRAADLFAAGFSLRLPAPVVYGVTFEIDRKLGAWSVPTFVSRTGDGFAWLPPGEYGLAGPRVGKIAFAVDSQGLRVLRIEEGQARAEVSAAAHRLTVALKGVAVFNVSVPTLATHTLIPDQRRHFQQGQGVEFSVVIEHDAPLDGRVLHVDLREGGADLPLVRKTLVDCPPMRHTLNFRLDTARLKPASYTLRASLAGEAPSDAPLTVHSPLPDTNFKVVVYGGYEKPEVLDRFATGGVNLLIHNGLGPHAVRARVGRPEDQRKYEAAMVVETAPVETMLPAPWFHAFLDGLQGRGMKLLAQFGSGHQFYHLSTCFMDPDVYKSVCRGTMAMAQVGRAFPNLVAFNMGDESGTHRGFEHPEGCAYCRELFEKRSGLPVPRHPRDGKEAWLRWCDFKQEMLPVLMRHVGQHVKQVADVMMSAQNGGANYWPQDGGYPPKGMTEFDVSAGHHYYAWAYGSVQTLWCALHEELLGTMPRRPAYWPFILAHTGLAGSKHEINLCLMRKCEGVGYFVDPEEAFPGQWKTLAEELHPRLRRFGDLFLALDRDRDKEVAIFYSYRQHALDCYVDEQDWVRPVRRYLDRVAMALYACLRGHIPAGFIGEEQIRAGDLLRRKALLLVALTEIEPEIRQAIELFIRRGGTVLADAETTVTFEGRPTPGGIGGQAPSPRAEKEPVPGMRKLDFAFGEFYDRWYRVGGFKDAKPPQNDDEVTIPLAKRLRDALKGTLPPGPFADSPHLILTEQRQGDASYLFLLNDRFAGIRKEGKRETGVFEPLAANLTIPNFKGVLYDVFEGKILSPRMEGANAVLPLDLPPGEMKLLALLPRAANRLTVEAHASACQLHVAVRALSTMGQPLDAALPLEITVTEPQGKRRIHVFRSTEGGEFFLTAPLGLNDAAGKWQVTVKELASGAGGTAVFDVAQPDASREAPSLLAELPDVIVYDGEAISRFLRLKREVSIVIGEARHEPLARRLARELATQRGIRAEVVFDTEVGGSRFPRFFGRGTARSDAGAAIAAPDIQIDRDLILLGTPLGNSLLHALYFDTELPPRLVTPDFPGRGRGVLQYVWQAFSDGDHDAVLVCAMDDDGLRRAAEELRSGVRH